MQHRSDRFSVVAALWFGAVAAALTPVLAVPSCAGNETECSAEASYDEQSLLQRKADSMERLLRWNAEASNIPWEPDYLIGQGIDSVTGELRSPKCVVNRQVIPPGQTGVSIYMSFKGVSSTESMRQVLDASSSASYKGFGTSTSAHAEFVDSQSLSSYEAAFVLKVRVQFAVASQLDPHTSWNASLNGRADIGTLCGDSFIHSASNGGVMYGVFKMSKYDYDHNTMKDADVKAKGWGAKIEMAISKAINSSTSASEIDVEFLQMGGSGSDWKTDTAPLSIDILKQKATTFPAEAQANPWLFTAGIMPWEKFFPDYKPANPISTELAQKQMDLLVDTWNRVSNDLAAISYILNMNPPISDFEHLQKTCLVPLEKLCQKIGKEIEDAYAKLQANYSAVITIPDGPESLDHCLPREISMVWKFVSIGSIDRDDFNVRPKNFYKGHPDIQDPRKFDRSFCNELANHGYIYVQTPTPDKAVGGWTQVWADHHVDPGTGGLPVYQCKQVMDEDAEVQSIRA